MKRILLIIMFVILSATIMASEEPIVEAAKKGDLEMVKTILAKDPAKLNATDKSRYTVLHWAVMRAHWNIAKFLINTIRGPI